MNRLFQAILSRFLKENLSGYVLKDEYRIKGMMSYLPGYYLKDKKQSPSPRQDFVIIENNAIKAILDAKYRDIWENGLPRDMLYQLAIYAMSQGFGSEATLLYPTVSSFASEARIAIKDPLSGSGYAQVVLRPVNVFYLEDLIFGKGDFYEKEREKFARSLVFGSN